MEDLSWPSEWGSYGKCTSVYSYTLDETFNESWCKIIRLSWFTKLLCFMDSQPWEDIESMLKSIWDYDLWVRP